MDVSWVLQDSDDAIEILSEMIENDGFDTVLTGEDRWMIREHQNNKEIEFQKFVSSFIEEYSNNELCMVIVSTNIIMMNILSIIIQKSF